LEKPLIYYMSTKVSTSYLGWENASGKSVDGFSTQLEREKSGATKGTVKQNSSSSVVDRPIKPSPSSEHFVLHATVSQMMQKIP